MKEFFIILAATWNSLWFTPDQLGQRYYEHGEFNKAAEYFQDPFRQGVALYRGGDFQEAAKVFSRINTAEAQYNEGNSLLMHGDYETAIARYDEALKKRPDLLAASENRALAIARKAMTTSEGGDMGDQKIGADKVVFDKKAENLGQDTQIEGDKPLSDIEIQALWLRRVQTKPADFLKAKFAFQHTAQSAEGVK
ncbi:tetratricopeptide repeat protein [Desulfosediminicola flagellatus]|uniref:tetratricopeptide repeat protein n=1 Tax=Desulfosediminicola flagellatus TaxID=2569541 RepID=UPI0010ACD680|nr:tetratricopeptide repeat protein [Desulfosediminicola flagellatus]